MGLYKKFRKFVTGARLEWPMPYREDRTLEQIFVRDPYIVKDGRSGYILTGTIYRLNYNDSYGTVIFKSDDLRTWKGPFTVIAKDEQEEEYCDFWAPEIHYAQGAYRIAVTLKPKNAKRGTYLFTSDSVDGRYKLTCRLTPSDKSSLDGTLVNCNGDWWCVYCYEYTDCKDGQIRAVKLSPDMSKILEDTDFMLFKASDNIYKPTKTRQKVTDGPFAFEKDGKLALLWSTQIKGGKYVQLCAISDDGTLHGKWIQQPPLYTEDGGHGMIFEDYDKARYLVLHAPNARTVFTKQYEHPVLIKL